MRRHAPTALVDIGEDVTNQAGWMYADLFLGLMVVFLATVTFIPEYLGGLNESARNSAFN